MRISSIVLSLTLAVTALFPAAGWSQTVLSGDHSVDGNLCAGTDCTGSESFPSATSFKLKSSNNRLLFEDTTVDPNFSTTDWLLEANPVIGTDGYFGLRNVDSDDMPFRVDDGAPDNALYVDDFGNVGLGTALPQTPLHVETATTDGIRLNRFNTRSGGQAWETSIFLNGDFGLSDITNLTTPFAMRPGTPNNAIFLEFDTAIINSGQSDYNFRVNGETGTSIWADGGTGDIGMGTDMPTAPLHVQRSDGTASLLVENDNGSPSAVREMFAMRNNGGSFFTLDNTETGTQWFFVHEDSAPNRFIITDAVADGPEMTLTADGVLTVQGGFVAGSTTLNVPDYVFAEDYALRPLAEVATFIEENSHLPEVPSAAEIAQEGLDVTRMQMALLKKVEELTLYTLEQDHRLARQSGEIAELRALVQGSK